MKNTLRYFGISSLGLLCAAAFSMGVAAEPEEGFVSIFNGRDLTGWDGNPKFWSVRDGAMTGQTTKDNPTKGNTFLIWKDGVTEDFELRLSYRIVGGNSGIQYRSKVTNPQNWGVGGYQADFEAGKTYSGILYDEGGVAGGRGIMAERGQKVVWDKDCKKQVVGSVGDPGQIQAKIKHEDWNEYVIIARGYHFIHKINGVTTVEVTDECESKRVKSGVLAMQLHAGPPMLVQFKNIRIKHLSGSDAATSDLDRVQGTWTPTEIVDNGQKASADLLSNIELTIKGNTFILDYSAGDYRGELTLNEKTTPRRIDVTLDDGTEVAGIYEVTEDSLRICYAEPGWPRPTAFRSAPGSGHVLAVYKRQGRSAAVKRILLIAGRQSHGPGDHEFRAGCLLLKKCLDPLPGIQVEVYTNGWPSSDSVFEGASGVVIYADGGGGHPAIQGNRIQLMDNLASQGVGIGFMHYAVEVPKGPAGEAMQRWIGGFYEHLYSVNPFWVPNFTSYPNHPVTRGVGSFALLDEWYFNMRWRPDIKGITHILVDTPSDRVRKGPYVHPAGPYEHIITDSGRKETMMWTYERPDGGRGFGFTGGHKHVNWAEDNYRKVVLNAILWVAKVDVPSNGVESTVKPEELAENLDPKGQSADAPNLTGHWTCHVQTEAGTGTPSFDFVHAGINLLGSYKGMLGEAVVFGSVNKNQDVRFYFTTQARDEELPVTYTGKIQNSKSMKGKVKFGELGEGTWTGEKKQ
jgi:uncharacterized protein (TIGR03067 family)